MKFGVVVFPGSNCDADIAYALEHNLGIETVKLWHKDTDLQSVDCVVLPGGFSYGDYLRSGAIARFSPIMDAVKLHAKNNGFVMAICNGFQIATEAGLLPGALLRNKDQKFVCQNVFLKPEVTHINEFTFGNQSGPNAKKAYKIPVAHAEGRYYADQETLSKLEVNNQILFRYATEDGLATEEANFNGSANNIAGICNENRNVFGMMPHPERAADSILGNTDGYRLLKSFVTAISARVKE